MPDASGRIPPVAIPRVPWCLRCKLVQCACPPGESNPTSRPAGYVGFDQRAPHRFGTPVVTERRSARSRA